MNLVLSHINYTIVVHDGKTMQERDVKTFTNEVLAYEFLETLDRKPYTTYGIKHTEVFKRGE
ncbi:hypothetical protein ETI10_10485 [Macrococcoides goetzii]|nr:hypothetical protein [Macrococcus goetzii]TDM39862.1 hypothetical protein ETI10_10485 [Macrococcus goetzii]